MKTPPIIAALLLLTAAAAIAATGPLQPKVSLSEGVALVGVARKAMHLYLTRRIDADRQPIPSKLNRLSKRPYAAAVTLRSRGRVVARSIESGPALTRNVIAASLKAMRSPKLDDRVTQEVLDSLTVEVEVLGVSQAVAIQPPHGEPATAKASPLSLPNAALAEAITPGLTGLMLTRGRQNSRLLPSTAYEEGLDAGQIIRRCLSQLPLTRLNVEMPQRWAVFATKHYVGFSDGPVVWLYRGKMLFPPEAIDDQMLLGAAERVGEYLIRCQDSTGLYRAGGSSPPLRQHLCATCAMARLAELTGRDDLAASVNAALAHAARFVKQDKVHAHVVTKTPADKLAATAMLCLAVSEAPQSEPGAKLRQRLVRYLRRGIWNDPAIAEASDKQTADRTDAAIAMTAIFRITHQRRDEQLLAALDKIIPKVSGDARFANRSELLSVTEAAWIGRAVTAASSEPDATHASVLAGLIAWLEERLVKDAAADEYGGLTEADNRISTAAAGLCAAMIGEAKRLRPTTRPRQGEQLLKKLQAFCYQMTYKPRETYFVEDPNRLVGAVRAGPASAAVTLDACAAAIEAFLAGRLLHADPAH